MDEYPLGRMMHLRSEFYSYSPGEMFSQCLDFYFQHEKEFMTILNTSILNTGLCGEIITYWFCSFDYQRVLKDLLTNSTFKEMHLSYHVCL